jgi:hypothetical protein
VFSPEDNPREHEERHPNTRAQLLGGSRGQYYSELAGSCAVAAGTAVAAAAAAAGEAAEMTRECPRLAEWPRTVEREEGNSEREGQGSAAVVEGMTAVAVGAATQDTAVAEG